jgi:predicted aldo/keto reductase-like oxidoreductase
MSDNSHSNLSRRSFLRGAAALGAGTVLAPRPVSAAEQTLPLRTLGSTKQQVTTLALGTWPCGRSSDVDVAGVGKLVHAALDLGITFIDTARAYGKAEEGIGKALGRHRREVFLATKVWADDAEEAAKSLHESLRTLRTEHVDMVYLHSVGNRDVERVLADDGALAYLLKQKEQGTTRFIGISGHSRVATFVPLIKTGQIDAVMMAMNFVDRHTYGFEQKVLPVAREHGLGIVCMKVFGGMRGGFATADGPNPGAEIDAQYRMQAIRYALELPGVATLAIGPHTVAQLRQNVQMVSAATPLSKEEQRQLQQVGQRLAQRWGPHYGPVT